MRKGRSRIGNQNKVVNEMVEVIIDYKNAPQTYLQKGSERFRSDFRGGEGWNRPTKDAHLPNRDCVQPRNPLFRAPRKPPGDQSDPGATR